MQKKTWTKILIQLYNFASSDVHIKSVQDQQTNAYFEHLHVLVL